MKTTLIVSIALLVVASTDAIAWANVVGKPCGAVPGPGYCVCWETVKGPSKIPVPGRESCEEGDSEGHIGCLRTSDCQRSLHGGGLILRPSAYRI